MLDTLAPYATQIALVLTALALGAVWVTAIASPNCSFDKLDGSRADRHVRELLSQTALPIAVLMFIAGGAFLVATSIAAAITAFITGFGFFTNRWMLAPRVGKLPPGAKSSRKGQRMVTVSFTLMFALTAVITLVLGFIGI